MTDFIVKHFVKDYEKTTNMSVRTSYGIVASVVGIICNVILFAMKFVIGLVLHSVSVIADSFNNLSDAGSSVISFVGVKMAGKPADKEHPFGHGHMEYIAALIVAFLVIEVGFTFLKEAIGKIGKPQEIGFQFISIFILLVSVVIKLWLSSFNRKLGKKLDSKVMLATATDSLGDSIITLATIASILVNHFLHWNIDAYVGIGVALLIMWAGIGIARDTMEPLVGAAVPKEVYEQITEFVESYEGILGTHDLIVHNYGPGRSMASVHAEVPNSVDVEISHEIIDRIEGECLKELGIFLVIHMDPLEVDNEELDKVKKKLIEALGEIDGALSIHDFRMVNGEEQINLIFDLVVPLTYTKEKRNETCKIIRSHMHALDTRYQCVIQVETGFMAEES